MKSLVIILILFLPLLAEIGKVTYIKGDVSVVRGSTDKKAVVGMKVEEKDVFLTKKDALVKLLFSDKSAVSIGSKSEFSIENYLFGEKENSMAKFKMGKGVFRMITGKIAKVSPDKFKLKTKTVTIGIRGTIFSGVVDKGHEEFFCEKGTIYVRSKGISFDIAKGYKTVVIPGRKPAPPKRYKASDLQKVRSNTSGWTNKNCK